MVSIVLPTHNRAKILPKAIQSVLDQTYQNWELVIWDDGSVDDTEKVVETFQERRIRYFYEVNCGKPYALNQAIARASGEYIAFLDDDDYWTPTKLELQQAFLNDHPEIDLVFGNFLNIDQANHKEGIGFEQNASALSQLSVEMTNEGLLIIKGGFLRGITKANFIAFDTVIIRKEAIKKIGLFNESLLNSEDFEFWWRFGLNGGQAAFTNEIILERNKYLGSLSSGGKQFFEDYIKVLDVCSELAILNKKEYTVKYLKTPYRNAWQNRIVLFGEEGNKIMAWKAFIKSLNYGVRPGSVKLVLRSMFRINKEIFDKANK